MSDIIQFQSRVDENGVLSVHVNLGREEATKDVIVTIESVNNDDVRQASAMAWPDFVAHTYGSCAGLGLERPEQGAFEMREPME